MVIKTCEEHSKPPLIMMTFETPLLMAARATKVKVFITQLIKTVLDVEF